VEERNAGHLLGDGALAVQVPAGFTFFAVIALGIIPADNNDMCSENCATVSKRRVESQAEELTWQSRPTIQAWFSRFVSRTSWQREG
jgi:hypothetical protein